MSRPHSTVMLTEDTYRRLLDTLARHKRMLRILGQAYLRGCQRALPDRDRDEMKALIFGDVEDISKINPEGG